ncbi:MAG TPA: cephalosporin hydroxylase family protein [Microvirga sp.]|jgi:cephalosporin hydroxylase|nr:cephalosporin hydroxylase family protein [Microvirga sp.]
MSHIYDDREDFLRERHERLSRLPADHPAWVDARRFFDATVPLQYSYNFDWLGVPIIQYPQDLVAIQEIIWRTKPDLIVETGVARGGSLIFYASMLRLLNNGGRVVGIDIDIRPHNRDSIEQHPLGELITLIEGSSTELSVIAQVVEHAKTSQRTMVVLDSNHTKDHVARELELYSPLVGRGSYLIVLDTVVEYMRPGDVVDRPWSKGNNPLNAVEEFLQKNNRFAIDHTIDNKLLISVGPRGYLECCKDPT